MAHPKQAAYDVLVAGAGPAGSTAAFHLAKAGLKVAVLDKCAFPRYKVCGGGVVRRALRRMTVAIDEVIESNCHEAELVHHQPDLHFRTTRAEPIVSMVMRGRLDQLLLGAAREAGAEVFTGCRVVSVSECPEWVEFGTEHFRVRGRFGIGADGARSVVAALCGWPPCSVVAPALECEVKINPRGAGQLARVARFDFGVVDSGYGWSFPKGGNLSVGVFTLRPGRCNLNQAVQRYLGVLGIDGHILSLQRQGAVLPLAPRKGGLVRGRILLVGDAGGLADPVTGEGISFALESGRSAALALAQGRLEQEAVAWHYQVNLQDLRRELRIGRAVAPLIYRSAFTRSALFRLYGERLCEALTDVFMGRRTYQSMISNPRNYLRLISPRIRNRNPKRA